MSDHFAPAEGDPTGAANLINPTDPESTSPADEAEEADVAEEGDSHAADVAAGFEDR